LLGGATFLALGDLPRAESLYRHVIELDPSNFEAYRKLAFVYKAQNRLDEAMKQYEAAARQQPKGAAAARTMIGMILTLQNKNDEARKQYEQALAVDPQAAVAANNLAWDYAEKGTNLDVALSLAQTAKARLPNSADASDTLGWIYYKKGLATLAITALKQGVEQNSADPLVRYHLGLAYLKNGDRPQAREALQQALQLNPKFSASDDARRMLATIKG
jgi:tetratricopeptide (TPR) repeat protein